MVPGAFIYVGIFFFLINNKSKGIGWYLGKKPVVRNQECIASAELPAELTSLAEEEISLTKIDRRICKKHRSHLPITTSLEVTFGAAPRSLLHRQEEDAARWHLPSGDRARKIYQGTRNSTKLSRLYPRCIESFLLLQKTSYNFGPCYMQGKVGFRALQLVDMCWKPDVHHRINSSLMYIGKLCLKLEHIWTLLSNIYILATPMCVRSVLAVIL